MGFPWQEYWSGLPFPSPGGLPKPGIEPGSPHTVGRCIKGSGSEFWEVMDMFIALILVMVSWVYAYLQTHQVVYIKYVQVYICQSNLNEVLFICTSL